MRFRHFWGRATDAQRQPDLTCPLCDEPVEQIETDLCLCRACGKVWTLDEAAETGEVGST